MNPIPMYEETVLKLGIDPDKAPNLDAMQRIGDKVPVRRTRTRRKGVRSKATKRVRNKEG